MIRLLKYAIAWFQIPTGSYCYKITKWKPFPGKALKYQPAKYYICPYWERAGFMARCNHLNITENVLLDDQCKICGIKDNE